MQERRHANNMIYELTREKKKKCKSDNKISMSEFAKNVQFNISDNENRDCFSSHRFSSY